MVIKENQFEEAQNLSKIMTRPLPSLYDISGSFHLCVAFSVRIINMFTYILSNWCYNFIE